MLRNANACPVSCQLPHRRPKEVSFSQAPEEVVLKLVILAGGLGTRLAEETSSRPKPMVEIGGRPILWARDEDLLSPRDK